MAQHIFADTVALKDGGVHGTLLASSVERQSGQRLPSATAWGNARSVVSGQP